MLDPRGRLKGLGAKGSQVDSHRMVNYINKLLRQCSLQRHP